MFHKVFRILFLFTISTPAIAQDSIAYTKNFVFNEGIYLNYDKFKHNAPIGIKNIVAGYDKTKLDFFNVITSKKEITYLDSTGNKTTINTSDIWGYNQNQALYINNGGEFFRIAVIGSLFHFIGYQYVQVGFNNPTFGFPQYPTSTVREQTQFIFDNTTRKSLVFNVTNMEAILQRDELLYKEFMALNKKKKRDSVFIYMRKYNEKYPLYLLK